MVHMQRIVLAARPQGEPGLQNFRLEETELADPGPGQMLLRTIWLSLDPYMRGRMDAAKSYAPAVDLGEVMTGGTVSEVVVSNLSGYAPGDLVVSYSGWCSHALSDGTMTYKLPPMAGAPLSTALGVLGMPGHTAWVGVNRILELQSGQTAVISAATGAVGSLAGQLAKARGCRVIGVAGGSEKCAFAAEELGFDACVDHRAAPDAKTLSKALADAAPKGVDAYFENVGGKTVEAVLPVMADHGRIALCGVIAWYNGQGIDTAMRLPAAWRAILVKRLRVQGFIIFDHQDCFPTFVQEVAPLVAGGQVTYRESVTEGLENAPNAFLGLLGGANFGKQLVRVGADP